MSDSEDDWFEKDIDEFVVQAQPSNVEIIEATDADTAEPINIVYADAGLLLPILYYTYTHTYYTYTIQVEMSMTRVERRSEKKLKHKCNA